MSYEFKEKIKEDLEYSLEGVSIDYYSSEELIHKQKVKELDNVYEQAALNKEKIKQIEETYKVRYSEHIELKRKADEYEAKAEAFDDIVGKYEGIMKEVRSRKFKVTSDVTLLGLEAEKVIKKYESGESNEL